jgi:hypothetical protein
MRALHALLIAAMEGSYDSYWLDAEIFILTYPNLVSFLFALSTLPDR